MKSEIAMETEITGKPEITANRQILRFRNGSFIETEDEIASEYALTIVVNYEELATIVCTPHNLEEMVIGFLASEGIIRSCKEISSIHIEEGRGFAYVQTRHKQAVTQKYFGKRFIGSCCGKSRVSFYFENDARTSRTVRSRARISSDQCITIMQLLQQHSSVFKNTGGVHNAALCQEDGQVVVSRTDIGRHNAIDKIYGYVLQHNITLDDKVMAFSGRISSEVLLKISKIGVGVLLSKSAPTTMALNMAEELNITTVGFIRGGGFNIYTHPERITG